jgi:alkylated DNA repair dioxygenase AlkB
MSITYNPSFLAPMEAWEYFALLRGETSWEQRSVRIMGKVIPQPRLIAWYGDRPYTYSGLTVNPMPFTPLLSLLKTKVEEATGTTFNSVLLNLYRNGNDSIAWHSDDEPELGPNPTIASVSLGAIRRFNLKHKTTQETRSLDLAHGSLLLMAGSTQAHWKHSVPKTKAIVGERINLTFRNVP